MSIVIIEDRSEFDELLSNWLSVYEADPEAQWFLSWHWLSQLYFRRDEPIRILAYRHKQSDEQFAAFFPLRRKVQLNKSLVEICTIYRLTGNYWADYNGLICIPEYEQAAISAFSSYIAEQSWRRFYLENLRMSEQRLVILLERFHNENYSIEHRKFGEEKGGPDLSTAPRIALPPTFESYLTNCLSSNTRQRIRRYRRKLLADSELEIRYCSPETIDDDLDRFEYLWKERWADEKGKQVDDLAERYSLIMHQGSTEDDMLMAVMTHKRRPIGMVACYIDDIKQTVLFFVAARESSFSQVPIGLLLHAHVIEFAIREEFKWYDFLRGDEPYKYSLGGLDELLKTIIVTSKTSDKHIDKEQSTFVKEAARKLLKFQKNANAEVFGKIEIRLINKAIDIIWGSVLAFNLLVLRVVLVRFYVIRTLLYC